MFYSVDVGWVQRLLYQLWKISMKMFKKQCLTRTFQGVCSIFVSSSETDFLPYKPCASGIKLKML